jgi:acylphosphatase
MRVKATAVGSVVSVVVPAARKTSNRTTVWICSTLLLLLLRDVSVIIALSTSIGWIVWMATQQLPLLPSSVLIPPYDELPLQQQQNISQPSQAATVVPIRHHHAVIGHQQNTDALLSAVPSASSSFSDAAYYDSEWRTYDDGVGFYFEVYGTVQGVSFRKHAQRKVREMAHATPSSTSTTTAAGTTVTNSFMNSNSKNVQLVGWIRNTSRGTVEGEVAISSTEILEREDHVATVTATSARKKGELQKWLQMIGSPKSHIDRVEFVDLPPERVHKLLRQMDDFVIRKTTSTTE